MARSVTSAWTAFGKATDISGISPVDLGIPHKFVESCLGHADLEGLRDQLNTLAQRSASQPL